MEAQSLPQLDQSSDRQEKLTSMQQQYEYNHQFGFPIGVKFQERDKASTFWTIKVLGALFKIRSNFEGIINKKGYRFEKELPQRPPTDVIKDLKNKDLQSIFNYYNPDLGYMKPTGRAASIRDYEDVFQKIKIPALSRSYASDESFAYGFLAGPNPIMLRRMTQRLDYFPVTSAHLETAPELGLNDIQQAIANGLVYYADYRNMADLKNGVHPQNLDKYVYAPLVAFAVSAKTGKLLPFAIQGGPSPQGRSMFTPNDGAAWKIARGMVLAAHNCYHEMISHLAFTHLLIEPIILATRRQLSEKHPIYILLDQHFEGTMPINFLAVTKLIQPGEAVDRLVGSDKDSNYRFIARERLAFSFRDNYLPRLMQSSQTSDSKILSNFPYRDDGMLVWEAIKSWVSDFIAITYTSDAVVRADFELQAWAAEISASKGGQVKNFGQTPGGIGSREDLIDILTMIIFTAGPQHAAVNFPQATDSAFLPANPLAGYIPEIKSNTLTEADWLAFLPPLDVAIRQAHTGYFLGTVYHGRLGYYDNIFSGATNDALKRYQKRLAEIDSIVDDRNKSRTSYAHLRPAQIPQSINI